MRSNPEMGWKTQQGSAFVGGEMGTKMRLSELPLPLLPLFGLAACRMWGEAAGGGEAEDGATLAFSLWGRIRAAESRDFAQKHCCYFPEMGVKKSGSFGKDHLLQFHHSSS